MIAIQQAIYGEVPGKTSGHDLLGASEKGNELFRQVTGKTDLSDRPEGSVLSGPVIRGFFAENHFLLVKTFPDKSPGIRSGRVFSHALFIPKDNLHLVHNLSNLFQYHLPGIQKEAQMRPIEHEPQVAIARTEAVDGREAAATNALMESEQLVWLGEEGYWEWITRIWPQMPAKVKHILKIGAAFSPSHVKEEDLNLLYIPIDTKTLWERHSFRTVDPGETGVLQSAAAHWLAGNTREAASFQLLIDDFVPQIESFKMLNQLQDYGKAYHQVDSLPELNRLLVLANFISQVSPNERLGLKGKTKLMTGILKAIPNAPVNMFTALTYQSWKGFPRSMPSVLDAVSDWLTNNLLEGESAKNGGGVIVKALQAETQNWWTKTVLDHVTSRLKKRQKSDALVLWQWMICELDLITQHTFWLPDDAEMELALNVPKLETGVAESVLLMTRQKDWLVLHAKVAANCYSAEKAIELQLSIDTDESHTEALEALSEIIKRSVFVSIAASHTDARLYQIAGKLIVGNDKLLKGIDISSKGWQYCWEAAVNLGNEVWTGISNPQHILFEVLDYLLAGNSFSEPLLNDMSSGKHSSLKDYPERASIWHKLSTKAHSGFITATLTELVGELATGQLDYISLEIELKNGLQSQEVLQQIIGSKTISLTKKIDLFYVLPGLKAQHAQQLLVNRFSPREAKRFGQLASEKKWKEVADALYGRHLHRKDLVPALLLCSNLLGVLKKIKLLYTTGLKRDAISAEEYWSEFLNISSKLFPRGPEENGLWISAGGDLSQLYSSGTGREKWSFAIRLLRHNETPEVERLIQKMREIYPGNETLKYLQNIL